jgi:hypothetical protein
MGGLNIQLTFFSERALIRKGTNSDKWGAIPFKQPEIRKRKRNVPNVSVLF